MNTIGISLLCAAGSIGTYLLIAKLSRKDESGHPFWSRSPFWRKLITPTPLVDFSNSSDENRAKREEFETAKPSSSKLPEESK